MKLIETSILSFIATAVTMVSGLVINKAVAIYIGPSGLALIGQFQSLSQLAMTAASGAINKGVTKYTAEYGKDSDRIAILFSTASKISFLTSIVVGVCLVFLSETASIYFLESEEHSFIFVIFGVTIVLFVLNNLLLSILNGLKEIKSWVKINIIQSLYSLVFTTILIAWLGLNGALIALVTNQSVIFLIVLWMLRHHPVIKIENFKKAFDKSEAKKLAGFAAMAITTAVTVPVSQLFIRSYLVENLSWEQAGYWQAMWYISNMYLMVIGTTLSIYYLPKLSGLVEKSDLRMEIIQGYKVIMPIVIVLSFLVFILKDIIIWLLFSKNFLPMRELFLWQLIGDVIKVSALLLAYIMHAKAMVRTYISTEIAFSLSFVVLSIWFVDNYGLVGMTYSYALNYTMYLGVVLLLTKRKWSK